MVGLIPQIEMLSTKLACSSAVVAWTFALSLGSRVAGPCSPKVVCYFFAEERKGPFHKQEYREFQVNLRRHYPPALFLPACNWLSHCNASFNGLVKSCHAVTVRHGHDFVPFSKEPCLMRGISRCNDQLVGSSRWFGKNCAYSPWEEQVGSIPFF